MRWHAAATDVVVAGAAFAVSVGVLAASSPVASGLREPDIAAYLLSAVATSSVILRRRLPVTAVLVGHLAGVAYAAAQYPVALMPVALLSVYTAATVLPPRRSRAVLAAALVLAALGTTFSPGPTDPGVPALVLSAWLLGSYMGSRRTYTIELERKNRQLEQAQRELAHRAVTEERLRIARELHDVVAHTMSVVAVHAGSGRMVAEDDPAAARRALATIETATRSALLEMRGLLGVLRDAAGQQTGAALAPTPGLLDLDPLAADLVRSRLSVELRVEGERNEVPAGVDLSAYRIVQEALTNVIKHAGPTRAVVNVRYEEDAVNVEVVDDGPGDGEPLAVPSTGGHGLVGMRERVALYGGRLDAGPRPTGGFRVAARLPFGRQV